MPSTTYNRLSILFEQKQEAERKGEELTQKYTVDPGRRPRNKDRLRAHTPRLLRGERQIFPQIAPLSSQERATQGLCKKALVPSLYLRSRLEMKPCCHMRPQNCKSTPWEEELLALTLDLWATLIYDGRSTLFNWRKLRNLHQKIHSP